MSSIIEKIINFLGTNPTNEEGELFYINEILPIDKRSIKEILEDREENGCSMCEDCGRKYGNYEMENGLIDYCPNCCKCFEGDCKHRGCGCGEDDVIIEEILEDGNV